MIFMEHETIEQNTASDAKRTVFIGAKVTPQQKEEIQARAQQCGMTVSNFKYTSALQGMSTSQRLTLFNQVPFMAGWFHKLRPITEAVSDFLTAVREQNRVPAPPKTEEEQ